MSKDCFFLDHSHGEDRQAQEHASKSNTWEAQMSLDLVLHLLKNGYKGSDIVVLTPYLGQVSFFPPKTSKK
jgi:superfamily I DNA and/or RNA helicase